MNIEIGTIFGFLVATEKLTNSKWLCKCICGVMVKVFSSHLTSGHTKSCGCKKVSLIVKAITKHGQGGSPKGTRTTEYRSWNMMVGRCNNPNNDRYKDYGGRGIKVCERWLKFSNFFEDMGNKPKDCSIDRIDTNGDYTPANCKWSNRSEQQKNKRTYKRRINGIWKIVKGCDYNQSESLS